MAGTPSDEIFDEVRSYFVDQVTPANSVAISRHELISLDHLLWKKSPVLRSKTPEDAAFFAIDCSENTLIDLLQVHRSASVPEDLQRLYNLLAVTEKLQLKELSLQCLRELFQIDEFWDEDYPEECSKEVVLACFKELLKTPFRTDEVNREHLERVLRHRDCLGLGLPVLQAFKPVFDEYETLGLERLPVHFGEHSIHAVIAYDPRRSIGLETGIFHDGGYIRVNLFGKNFNLAADRRIDGFYIKWASYVLYLHDGSVYRQNLNQSEAVEVIANCSFFISRERDVFIMTKEDSEYRVLRWVDDDGNAGNFEVIYCKSAEILSMDFDSENLLLSIAEISGSISVFKLRHRRLVLKKKIIACSGPGSLLFAIFYRGCLVYAVGDAVAGITKMEIFPLADLTVYSNFEEACEELNNDEFASFCRSGGVFFFMRRNSEARPYLVG